MNAPARPPSEAMPQRERLPILDLLRFLAALAVVFYHLTYVPKDSTLFGSLQSFSRFGYLGVDLFFILSGFVILWSATGRTVFEYLVSRVARLYPSFWIGILITTLTLLAIRPERLQPPWAILANFTMLPGYVGAKYVDGVYWTLQVELKFYFLIFLCMLFRQTSRVELWLWVWLGLTAICQNVQMPAALQSLIIFPLGIYFISGCMFYLIWRHGLTRARCVAVLFCLELVLVPAIEQHLEFVPDSDLTSTGVVIALLIGTFGLFFAISLRAFDGMPSRISFVLGSLTYPLYLIHNEVGKAVFHRADPGGNEWLRLALALLVVSVITWVMAVTVEQRLSPAIRRLLLRARPRRPREIRPVLAEALAGQAKIEA